FMYPMQLVKEGRHIASLLQAAKVAATTLFPSGYPVVPPYSGTDDR
ncbi:hypothetical protein AVEN_188943-1, partial [Araneus ventricosus]